MDVVGDMGGIAFKIANLDLIGRICSQLLLCNMVAYSQQQYNVFLKSSEKVNFRCMHFKNQQLVK